MYPAVCDVAVVGGGLEGDGFMEDPNDVTPTQALASLLLYPFPMLVLLIGATAYFLGVGLARSSGDVWPALLLPISLSVALGLVRGIPVARTCARGLADDPYGEWAWVWTTWNLATPWNLITFLVCLIRRKPLWPQRPDWRNNPDRWFFFRVTRRHGIIVFWVWQLVWVGWLIGGGAAFSVFNGPPGFYLGVAVLGLLPWASSAVSFAATLLWSTKRP